MTKSNEQHQFDLLYGPHNAIEENTYNYILTSVNSFNTAGLNVGPRGPMT